MLNSKGHPSKCDPVQLRLCDMVPLVKGVEDIISIVPRIYRETYGGVQSWSLCLGVHKVKNQNNAL